MMICSMNAAEIVAWFALGGEREDYRCNVPIRCGFLWLGWTIATMVDYAGVDRRGVARPGGSWQGRSWQARLGAVGLGLSGPGQAWQDRHGLVRPGAARPGRADQGTAGTEKHSTNPKRGRIDC